MKRRSTVREALEAAAADTATVSRRDFPHAAYRLWRQAGGVPRPAWTRSRAHLDALEVVYAACTAQRADPLLYVQAQVETVGFHAIQAGRRLQAGALRGPNADERFARWMARKNGKRASLTRNRSDEAERERREAAASAFGVAYLADGADLRAAAEASGVVLENLSPRERLTALAAGMDALVPNMSSRVLVPDRWTFPEARRFVREVAEAADRAVAPVGDGSLGSFI